MNSFYHWSRNYAGQVLVSNLHVARAFGKEIGCTGNTKHKQNWTYLVNHLSKPVTLKMNTNAAVVKPADTVSSIENFLAIATAAIA